MVNDATRSSVATPFLHHAPRVAMLSGQHYLWEVLEHSTSRPQTGHGGKHSTWTFMSLIQSMKQLPVTTASKELIR